VIFAGRANAGVPTVFAFFEWGKISFSIATLFSFLANVEAKEVAMKKLEKYVKPKLIRRAAIYLGRAPKHAFDQLFNASMPYMK